MFHAILEENSRLRPFQSEQSPLKINKNDIIQSKAGKLQERKLLETGLFYLHVIQIGS